MSQQFDSVNQMMYCSSIAIVSNLLNFDLQAKLFRIPLEFVYAAKHADADTKDHLILMTMSNENRGQFVLSIHSLVVRTPLLSTFR